MANAYMVTVWKSVFLPAEIRGYIYICCNTPNMCHL